jgi:anti-sigma regulatory factor (Ser/Thr protein kinase)
MTDPRNNGHRRIRVVQIALPSIDPDPGALTLSVPGHAEGVRVVRAVMRSWAATAGLTVEEIEDLCLAVDEVFAGLLAAQSSPQRLAFRIREERDGVDVTATSDARTAAWPPEGFQESLTWRVLSTLADEVRFERIDEGPAIHLVKQRGSPAKS